MGFLDFLLTAQQKKDKVAIAIGLEAGLFVECPVCRDVTEADNPEACSDRLHATIGHRISANDPGASLFQGGEAEILQTLERVAKNLPFSCRCETV